MAAIDGQFDTELTLTDGDKNVEATGTLKGFGEFDLTLHVVVVDKMGLVAEFGRKNPELKPGEEEDEAKWALTVPVTEDRSMKEGSAVAYAMALGTGVEGIKSWQWHSVVKLVSDQP